MAGMPTYVAFLRAINLGAIRKFAKDDIRRVVESLGFTDVETHINTGNVRFTTAMRSRAKIEKALEDAFAADRGFDVPTMVFTTAEIAEDRARGGGAQRRTPRARAALRLSAQGGAAARRRGTSRRARNGCRRHGGARTRRARPARARVSGRQRRSARGGEAARRRDQPQPQRHHRHRRQVVLSAGGPQLRSGAELRSGSGVSPGIPVQFLN